MADVPPLESVVDDDEFAPEERATVLHVDRGEDIASICGRVEMAPTSAVILWAPAGNRSLATELGIRRLLRHAEESGKQVAIATASVGLASRARQARIPVARRPEHVRWDAPGRIALRLGPVTLLLPAIGRYLQVAAILAVAAVAVGLALTMGPSATVVLYPPTETLEESVSVSASPNFDSIDPTRLRVPAVEVSTTRTLTLAARTTGLAPVGVAAARAQVVLTNPGASAVRVPAGTVLLSEPGGTEFTLDADIEVPAGGQATGSVTARVLGTAGNVPAGTISRFADPRFSGLQAANPEPAEGGANEDRPAVAQQDVLSLRELAHSLSESAEVRALLAEDRPHDAVFLGTAEVDVEVGEPQPPVGTPAAVVLLPVTVRISALAIPAETLERFAREVLRLGQGAGAFVPGTVRAEETGARQYDPENEVVTTELRVQAEFAPGIDEAEIRKAVRGKSPDEVRRVLRERYGSSESDVRLFPGFAPWLPRFGFRIDVEIRSPSALEPGKEPAAPEANDEPDGAALPQDPRPRLRVEAHRRGRERRAGALRSPPAGAERSLVRGRGGGRGRAR
ncbi:hypothetical protein HRbin29_01273 [bacterium HR29]|nr:hypothetical protein HRbin29_01273 [bacterium HR29]